jgi:tetratricopeptide (TPR) repeat protein
MKLFLAIICICCSLCFTSVWASDSDKTKLKKAFSQYQSLFNQGEYAKSLPYVEQALELSKAITGTKSKTTATLSHNYGLNLLRAYNKEKEARKVLSDTVPLYKEIYGSEAPELISLYIDLSDAQRAVDYKSNWFKPHDWALSIAENAYGKDSADYGMLLVDLGHVEMINQAPDGERRLRKGYEILLNLKTPHPEMYRAEFIIGKLYLARRNYKDSRTHLENSLKLINEGKVGQDLEQPIHAFLVEALENLGESELATEHALEIGRKQAEAGVSDLQPLFIIKPNFPTIAINQQTGTRLDVQKRNEGKVVLEFDVDKKGHTQNIRVYLLDGPNDFVSPAIEAVKQFRYAPRFVDGEPVEVTNLRYGFSFLLKD